MSDFFHMGGYAVFVWLSYGLVLIVMAGLWWRTWRAAKYVRRQVEVLKPQRPLRAPTNEATPALASEAGAAKQRDERQTQ